MNLRLRLGRSQRQRELEQCLFALPWRQRYVHEIFISDFSTSLGERVSACSRSVPLHSLFCFGYIKPPRARKCRKRYQFDFERLAREFQPEK